ncbi:zinc-dependent alcohol dehydrogenase family protein [Sphingobium boeckii]|uniref:enoyl-[acyl-carrier-protein] reductase n=1 Tax=Sphingobium boeckii TaxID=1082345 RepID=A0A7W9AK78_9SPHN|nr:zinc-dependent alcohol dehydrogenase family protein [Sphingobium boeckii]MBB5687218.1 NADPH:quinone reductase-like Zn-dependent oxidoreductase [Sphingobium boeckii]
MRCLEYLSNGAAWDVIGQIERPTPEPAGNEVIVALEAAPVHIADLKAIEGGLAFIPQGPGTPGFEGVGRIIECGAHVDGWKVGDRVILPLAYGAWREHRAVAAQDLWHAPDHVPAEQLALVRINLTTAWLLLNAYVDLQPGDWIIQNAANSNVTGYTAALAASCGIGMIDLVRRPELIQPLKESGRIHVALDTREAIAAICEKLGARPRLSLDAIGGDATARLGNVTADNGLVLAYGFLSEQPYQLDYPDAMFRNVRLEAMMIDRAVQKIGREGRDRMAEALQSFIATEPLNAEIAAVYSFDQAPEALRHAARTGEARAGKIILVP